MGDVPQEVVNEGTNISDVPNSHDIEEEASRQSENVIDVPRKSDRQRHKPKLLENYETVLPPSIHHPLPTPKSGASTVHPIYHFVSYKFFSNAHKIFLAAITSRDEAKYFHQAVKDPAWCEAM